MPEPARAVRPSPELISVVVPLLDDAEHLPAQLQALAGQDYAGRWEVVIADNGSTDGSEELAGRSLGALPNARLVRARGVRSAGHTRNVGAAHANGDFLAFCDADDVARSDWLTRMAAAARGGDIVAGGVDIEEINPPLARSWNRSRAAGRSPQTLVIENFRFLVHASGTNTGVWADVFERVGGFDECFGPGEDIEFSWRAQLAGYRLAVAPDAVVHERLRLRIGALAVQYYGYGKAGPRLYRSFRGIGMPPRPARRVARALAWLAGTLPALPFSARLRRRWTVRAGLQAGRLAGSVRNRILYV